MIGALTRAAFRGYEWLKAADPRLLRENARWRAAHPSPWPYPPPRRRVEVAGTTHLAWFEEGGRRAAECLTTALDAAGEPPSRFDSILDFGCGCGRVIRHLPTRFSARLHGCDINHSHIDWCRRHLPFAEFRACPLVPPSPFADGAFDLLYAFSVLTHLTVPMQQAWMREFDRILAPDGCLAISVHGERSARQLEAAEREAFSRGEIVVRFENAAGSNLCNSYHPRVWVEGKLAAAWEVAAFLEEGALGNPHQDLYLLRKRS